MYHRKLFKHCLIACTLIASTYTHSAYTQSYEQLDKAIAIVEDKVILQSELDQRIAALQAQQTDFTITETIKSKILDQLIVEELQLHIAERIKLPISEGDIDGAMTSLLASLDKNGEDMATYLAKQRLDEPQLRQSIARQMKIDRVQEGTVNRRIRVTDREIDEFLTSKSGQEWLKIRFNLSHILLPITGGNEATMVAKAQSLVQQANTGEASFEALAAKHSQGPNAPKGGQLGWREKKQLPDLFLEQVATLKPGSITPPFRSNAGIHILKVNQRSGAEPVMVQRYKVRHILVKSTELFTEAEAKAKIDQLHQQLQQGSDFASLAKQHTDDTGSKFDGGDLGWSTPGAFVPAFEETMKTTPTGNISAPFRSQFGWHILTVEDTKVEDMFDTVKRNRVASILRQRRFNDELQLWLQEIREDAYVELL